jgi:hypothetical protein
MAIRSFPDYREGQRPSAGELNRMAELVESIITFTSPRVEFRDAERR